MHACVRHASARLASFIDQFIASLDQRLQAYKLLAGQFGCFGCLSTSSPEELLTAAKTRVDLYPNDLALCIRRTRTRMADADCGRGRLTIDDCYTVVKRQSKQQK